MRKKRGMSIFVNMILVIGLCMLTASGTAKTLRFAHYASQTHPLHKAAMLFKKTVEEQTDGRLKIEVYPANTLGSTIEILESIQTGAVDMTLNTTGQLLLWTKEAAALQLPFIYEGPEHVYKVMDGKGGEALAKLAARKNFHIVSYWDWGFRNITNNVRPIWKPEDVSGLKLRVPPEIPMEVCMKALGAIPQKIAWAELYMALAQGVVDGQENPVHAIYHAKFYEQQKYIAMVNYMYNPAIHIMSPSVWDGLSKQEQFVIEQASFLARDYMRRLMKIEESRLLAKIKDAGCVITYPDIGPFRDKMDPAIVKIAEYAGLDFTRKWVEWTKEYAQKDETKRYLDHISKILR